MLLFAVETKTDFCLGKCKKIFFFNPATAYTALEL